MKFIETKSILYQLSNGHTVLVNLTRTIKTGNIKAMRLVEEIGFVKHQTGE